MSVLVKARPGGSNYIYSVLMGYEDPPPGMVLDDGIISCKTLAAKDGLEKSNCIFYLIETLQ